MSISVTVGQATTADVQLSIGATTDTVQVTAEAAAVQTEDNNISTSFTRQQIALVPNPGQDMTYIAQTAPGAVMNTQGGLGNFSIFGLPGTSTIYTVNGMDYNSSYLNVNKSGATNNSLGTNEMESVTAVNNGYSGRYGRLVGSNINYVTKSGSNQFHGTGSYNWNGRAMNANDFFNNKFGTPRPFDNVNQWAWSVGGPIWKDRTFFYVNQEGLRIVLPTSFPVNIPSPQFQQATLANLAKVSPGSIPFYQKMFSIYNSGPNVARALNVLPNGGCGTFALPGGGPCALQFQASPGNFTYESLIAWRIDQIIGTKDQMFLRFQTDHGDQATSTDPFNPVFNTHSPQPEWQGQWNETHTFSSKAVNQFVAAFQWSSVLFGPKDIQATLNAFPTLLSFDGGSFTSLGINQAALTGRNITQYQFVDDFSVIKGNHTLGAGLDFRRDDVNIFDFGRNTAGSVLTSLSGFFNGQVTSSFSKAFPVSFDLPFAVYNFSFYGEDEWHVKPNLKLTLALRLDHNSNPVCQRDCFARFSAPFDQINHDVNTPYNAAIQANVHQAFYDTTMFAPQPRLGFAWSPSGGRNTVIRGGFGIFADSFPETLIGRFAFNSPRVNNFVVTGALSPDVPGSVFSNAGSSNASFLDGFAKGLTLAQLKATNPAFATPGYFGAERFTAIPTYQEWNLEIQHTFAQNTVVSINYVGNHGIHEAFLNAGLNAYCPAASCPGGFAGLPAVPPDPRFSTVTTLETEGVSNYNGLVLSVHRSLSHGFQAGASYTYGHALDDVSNGGFLSFTGGTNSSIMNPQNPQNRRANYGNSDYDTRHSLNASYLWTPALDAWIGRGQKRLWSGWTISGTFFARTGLPFTVLDGQQSALLSGFNNGGQVFANYLGGSQPTCNVNNNCLIASQFTNAKNGFGNQARNQFRGPAFFNTDVSILKHTKLPMFNEKVELVFGAQFFNVLNHANFDQPVGDITNPQFGLINRAVATPSSVMGSFLGGDASPRQIQLTAKFVF